MTTTKDLPLTVTAPSTDTPAYEIFRNNVTASYDGLGEPGLPVFREWLAGQPEDQYLTALAAEVVVSEQDLLGTRARIADLLADRRHAEDRGDGLLFSNCVAALGGLPRLLAHLGAERVRRNLRWLARAAVLASAAALLAEGQEEDVRHDAAVLRRELFSRSESGALPHEGQMSEREAASQHILLRRYLAVLEPHTEAGQRARECAETCRIRARFYDPAGDSSRLDLGSSSTWEPALTAAAVKEQKIAEKEIKNAH